MRRTPTHECGLVFNTKQDCAVLKRGGWKNMPKNWLPYNPYLKQLAKTLRNNMTLSEILLWQQLKKKQLDGFDFDRQKPIDEFIVDFYCKELKLAIEIDGSTHDNEKSWQKDQLRQKRLEQLGVSFLRFSDKEIKENLEGVLTAIRSWIQTHP